MAHRMPCTAGTELITFSPTDQMKEVEYRARREPRGAGALTTRLR
jgi:hypothetical protein